MTFILKGYKKITKHFFLTGLASLSFISTLAQSIPITGSQYHLYGPNSTWSEYLQVGGNGNTTNYAFVAATNGNLHLDSKSGFCTYINYYNQGNTFLNPEGGLVGVGTTSPTEKFNVNSHFLRLRVGNAIFKGNSYSSFNSFTNGQDLSLPVGWIAVDFGGRDNLSDRFVVGTGFGGKVVIGTHTSDLTNWGGDLLINPAGGNVAIGTTTARERLSVNGTIRSKEVKVEVANWPDYVFDDSFKLPSLVDLHTFILANNHLPNIPTASEVANNGISLGEMNKKLLEKIEELTLYLIEKDLEIKEQKTAIAAQEKRLGTTEKLIAELKEVLIKKARE